MKTFEEMTIEERMEVYNNTINDIGCCCCDYDSLDFSNMDGICPDCGRATYGARLFKGD